MFACQGSGCASKGSWVARAESGLPVCRCPSHYSRVFWAYRRAEHVMKLEKKIKSFMTAALMEGRLLAATQSRACQSGLGHAA